MSKELFNEYKKYTLIEQQRLLAVLADQLKVPLLQLARASELGDVSTTNLKDMNTLAIMGLDLVEHYQLSLRLQAGKSTLLEPVSLGAVLHRTADRLSKLAKLYNCDIELELPGNYPPVLAHSAGLEAALSSLGAVFIEAQSQATPKKRAVVTLAAHKSRWGLVAGAYGEDTNFSPSVLRQARSLYGFSKQPLNQVLASAGAGVFIADALLHCMSGGLRSARYHKRNGLAVTLTPSQQLRLV